MNENRVLHLPTGDVMPPTDCRSTSGSIRSAPSAGGCSASSTPPPAPTPSSCASPSTSSQLDLALTAAPAQHLLFSVARAQRLLGWAPEPADRRIAESVRWHLAHPPDTPTWGPEDAAADDAALARHR